MKSTNLFIAFIAFEGLDGSGKTTQSRMLHKYFESKNIESILIFDPGTTDLGNKVREMVKSPITMNPLAEAYLFAAARSQLVQEVIAPALKQGKTVVCDRFFHSSLAYQTVAGLSKNIVEEINKYSVGLMPHITFFINTSAKESIARKERIEEESDRFEKKDMTFHKKVHEAYKKMSLPGGFMYSSLSYEAAVEHKMMIEINGHDSPENIHKDIVTHVEKYYESEKLSTQLML